MYWQRVQGHQRLQCRDRRHVLRGGESRRGEGKTHISAVDDTRSDAGGEEGTWPYDFSGRAEQHWGRGRQ